MQAIVSFDSCRTAKCPTDLWGRQQPKGGDPVSDRHYPLACGVFSRIPASTGIFAAWSGFTRLRVTNS